MGYYLRTVPGLPPQVWKIETEIALRIGVSNPEQSPGAYFKANPGESIWDAIRREASSWFGPNGESQFHATILGPGQFYPRVARPIDQHPEDGLGWTPSARIEQNIHLIAVSRGQLTALARQLGRICQTVQPTEQTLDVFGHDIRNLLILACTEVESHWRGVLAANGVDKERYSTQDYVKLQRAMRLDEFEVDFPDYPWLEPFRPFIGWRHSAAPTKDLPWYDAYNAVKHSREAFFERGTLRHAFEAIGACAIMIAAQFGLPLGLGKSPELRSFFNFACVPSWPLAEVYLLPYDSPTGEWKPVSFPFEL